MTHICIDGFNLALPHGTGIATYARTLNSSIQALGHETSVLYGRNVPNDRRDPVREALFFGVNESMSPRTRVHRAIRSLRAALSGGVRPVEIPSTGLVARDGRLDIGGTIWNSRRLFDAASVKFRLTGRLLTIPNPGNVDICHWTCPLPVRMRGARNFYTFHDLIPIRYPHLVLDNAAHFYGVARAIVASADRIVTVSDHSRREILEHLPITEGRVINTSQAVAIPSALSDGDGALEIYDLEEGGYYISFSAIEPKKNISRLIEGYMASGTSKKLVIVGHYTWLPQGDIRMLTNMGLWSSRLGRPQSGGKIQFLGHLSRAHLDRLIRGAYATLFPSLTEGFGLPILEAMGRGTAVLTSKGGATEEVAGDAAQLVDPLSSASIAAGIRSLDQNPDLVQKLVAKGHHRAKLFSEEVYLQKLSALYD